MADGSNKDDNVALSVPVGAAVTVLALAAGTAAAYMLLYRGEESSAPDASRVAKSGKGLLRKGGLLTLVTLIENDATRKVVVALLRAMAKRS